MAAAYGAANIPATITGLPVTSIRTNAFAANSSITSVTIPDSVTDIGDYAFRHCTKLTAITVDMLNPTYSSLDGVLFNQSQTTLIQFPGGKAGSYAIPNTVTNIGNSAFSVSPSLISITIPDTVISIGSFAFSACSSLTAITVDPLNPFYSSLEGVLFDQPRRSLIVCPGGKAGSFTIPNSVTNILSGAFSSCAKLTNITLDSGVNSIGSYAFQYCYSLTNISIPNSVSTIGTMAFYACTSLKRIFFRGNTPTVGSWVFYGDNHATVYYLPDTTGWGATFAGRPTALWKPQMLARDPTFGVQTNQFGFNIAWASGMNIVVEACTNLANPVWFPLQTNTLPDDTFYFSDPEWTNSSRRFYRIRWP